jgi:hypothetical protein
MPWACGEEFDQSTAEYAAVGAHTMDFPELPLLMGFRAATKHAGLWPGFHSTCIYICCTIAVKLHRRSGYQSLPRYYLPR